MTHRRKLLPRPWKKWADDYLSENYGKLELPYLCMKLLRTKSAIVQRAHKLKIAKPQRNRSIPLPPERYEQMMIEAARAAGVRPVLFFSNRGPYRDRPAKYAVWAALRGEGYSYVAIARAGGLDHSSVIWGCRRHAEMRAAT